MKNAKNNNGSEYRVYFFRLKKEDDNDLIQYLDSNIHNFTEYFRTLVRNDMETSDLDKKLNILFQRTDELQSQYNKLESSTEELKSMLYELLQSKK